MSEIKLVLVGIGGVGKSALTISYVSNVWVPEYDPTIEDSHRKQVCIDDVVTMLDILDTAGQEEYSSMQDQWFRSGQGFIVVFSLISKKSFMEVTNLVEKILRIKDKKSVPMVLAANKCDLVKDREVTQEEGQNLAKKWTCPYYETSAKDKINVEEVFKDLVRQVRQSESTKGAANGTNQPSNFKQMSNQRKKGGGCIVL
eukprot:TRINITY_DN304_c0_g1_i1.p1 TRINITY_DN304_c0_g1~~TRINITY_DN304_c0_g1_i1.p1  ORF type:complete len:200 (-),score=54.33 TRINITY_DN304_c0_g1_i1:499-1098(-)